MPLRNWEIVVYALYSTGGAAKSVHTEDIAVECWKIAPASFSWAKYPGYPDKDIVRVALTDARKEKMGKLVIGRSGTGKGHAPGGERPRRSDGWQLTEAGATWVAENAGRVVAELGHNEVRPQRQELLQKLQRLRNHQVFREFLDRQESFKPTVGMLAELLRCRADAEPSVWQKRFSVLRNHAKLAAQEDVLRFVDICESFINSRRQQE